MRKGVVRSLFLAVFLSCHYGGGALIVDEQEGKRRGSKPDGSDARDHEGTIRSSSSQVVEPTPSPALLPTLKPTLVMRVTSTNTNGGSVPTISKPRRADAHRHSSTATGRNLMNQDNGKGDNGKGDNGKGGNGKGDSGKGDNDDKGKGDSDDRDKTDARKKAKKIVAGIIIVNAIKDRLTSSAPSSVSSFPSLSVAPSDNSRLGSRDRNGRDIFNRDRSDRGGRRGMGRMSTPSPTTQDGSNSSMAPSEAPRWSRGMRRPGRNRDAGDDATTTEDGSVSNGSVAPSEAPRRSRRMRRPGRNRDDGDDASPRNRGYADANDAYSTGTIVDTGDYSTSGADGSRDAGDDSVKTASSAPSSIPRERKRSGRNRGDMGRSKSGGRDSQTDATYSSITSDTDQDGPVARDGDSSNDADTPASSAPSVSPGAMMKGRKKRKGRGKEGKSLIGRDGDSQDAVYSSNDVDDAVDNTDATTAASSAPSSNPRKRRRKRNRNGDKSVIEDRSDIDMDEESVIRRGGNRDDSDQDEDADSYAGSASSAPTISIAPTSSPRKKRTMSRPGKNGVGRPGQSGGDRSGTIEDSSDDDIKTEGTTPDGKRKGGAMNGGGGDRGEGNDRADNESGDADENAKEFPNTASSSATISITPTISPPKRKMNLSRQRDQGRNSSKNSADKGNGETESPSFPPTISSAPSLGPEKKMERKPARVRNHSKPTESTGADATATTDHTGRNVSVVTTNAFRETDATRADASYKDVVGQNNRDGGNSDDGGGSASVRAGPSEKHHGRSD